MAKKDVSLRMQAYSIIKDKIINCEYRPGTMITEDLLIDELKLTRTPIRDALGRLEQEGLLTIKPKRGILITPLRYEEATHLVEARMLYETYAIREYGAFIDERALISLYQQMLAISKTPTRAASNTLDANLHKMIIEAVPNTYIRSHYQIIDDQIKRLKIRLRIITGVYHRRLQETQDEHLAIIGACLRKDWQEAECALREHLTASNKIVIDLFLSKLEAGDTIGNEGKVIA